MPDRNLLLDYYQNVWNRLSCMEKVKEFHINFHTMDLNFGCLNYAASWLQLIRFPIYLTKLIVSLI